MARDLFVASWDKGPAMAWAARHGLTAADYQKAFDDFARQGYRLRSISGYNAGGQDRYAAIWDKRGGPAWVARHNLSAADYQKTFDDLNKQGYRLRQVTGYEVGGRERFAAYWEQATGPAWTARHNLSPADYQKTFDDLNKQGYRLRWVNTYAVGGQDRYAAVWEKSGGPAWQARHRLEESAFRAQAATLAAQGYDLVCASAASFGGRDYYAALWEQTPTASIAHHGMTGSTYQLKFDQLVAQGYQPRFVAGYAGEDPVDVQLRFTMQRQTQGNWCWAATSVSIAAFYGTTGWTQCSMANAQLGRGDCCGTGASGPCNVYGYLGDAIQRTGHLRSEGGGTATFAQVEAEAVAGRPLGIRVAWSGGGAHFIAATGIEDDSLVYVSDCGSGTTSLVDYATLLTSYRGSGRWTHTYYTKP